MWVFNLLNLFLLHKVFIESLCLFGSHLVFVVGVSNFLVFKYGARCVLLLPDKVRPM